MTNRGISNASDGQSHLISKLPQDLRTLNSFRLLLRPFPPVHSTALYMYTAHYQRVFVFVESKLHSWFAFACGCAPRPPPAIASGTRWDSARRVFTRRTHLCRAHPPCSRRCRGAMSPLCTPGRRSRHRVQSCLRCGGPEFARPESVQGRPAGPTPRGASGALLRRPCCGAPEPRRRRHSALGTLREKAIRKRKSRSGTPACHDTGTMAVNIGLTISLTANLTAWLAAAGD